MSTGGIVIFVVLVTAIGGCVWLIQLMRAAAVKSSLRAPSPVEQIVKQPSSSPVGSPFRATPVSNLSRPQSGTSAVALGKPYRLEYGDADGVVTERVILMLGVQREFSTVYVRAKCSLRNAERTFKASRILSMSEAETGLRIADPVKALENLGLTISQPDPEHRKVMARVGPGLSALIWIARSDREVTSDECEILLNFIQDRNGLAGASYADAKWSKPKALVYIDEARPTFATAVGAVSKMSRSGKEYALVDDYARRMALAGGSSAGKRYGQLFRPA